jgi:HTH-type transcriptional regulator / antitoxin HipB
MTNESATTPTVGRADAQALGFHHGWGEGLPYRDWGLSMSVLGGTEYTVFDIYCKYAIWVYYCDIAIQSEVVVATARARIKTPADVGLALQQARLEKGLTQVQVAEMVGQPQSTISQLESGASTIYLKRLLVLAKALDLELTAAWELTDEADR